MGGGFYREKMIINDKKTEGEKNSNERTSREGIYAEKVVI